VQSKAGKHQSCVSRVLSLQVITQLLPQSMTSCHCKSPKVAWFGFVLGFQGPNIKTQRDDFPHPVMQNWLMSRPRKKMYAWLLIPTSGTLRLVKTNEALCTSSGTQKALSAHVLQDNTSTGMHLLQYLVAKMDRWTIWRNRQKGRQTDKRTSNKVQPPAPDEWERQPAG
jgi:hypothetical protein